LLTRLTTETPASLWNIAKTALASGNIDAAMTSFSSVSREKYRRAFYAMGTTELAALISEIPSLSPVVIESDTAEYSFDQALQGVTLTFVVKFIKENGLWKIKEF
jgi:hypothetical protein